MFYEMVSKMVHEMAFVAFAMWIAMTALEKRQTVFRWTVIGGALLFGVASFSRMPLLAVVFQRASLLLMLVGWICKVRWQFKDDRSGTDNE